MKIAVGTDDLKTIRSGHFGESKYYRIFTIENNQITNEEVRENPYLEKNDHEHGQAKNIMQLLKDCDVFLARSMGMHSMPKLVSKGKKPLITKNQNIDEVIQLLLNQEYHQFKSFDKETGKLVPFDGRF